MPRVTMELTAQQDAARRPIVWRLGKLFNVVTNVLRARVSEEYAHVELEIEGSTAEVEQAVSYLRGLGLSPDAGEPPPAARAEPEKRMPQPSAIYVRLSAVRPEQARVPILHRIAKDQAVVVNIERAALDADEGGYVEVALTGPLIEVQRAIAYLHTTGLHVSPRQRSVTDFANL